MATLANPTVPLVHRKPVTGYNSVTHYSQPAYAAAQYAANNTASRTPPMAYPASQSISSQDPAQSRRTLSTSSNSTTNTNSMQRVPTGNNYASGSSSSIRRSTSSRSNTSSSPTSYVALMRKQKATVWCDRAQHQDPRILAAQRQAKMRAVREVAGGQTYNPAARISTSSSGGVRSKIRHHGAQKAKDYGASGNMSGAGVPMRLSATEVDEDDGSDDEQRAYHRASSSRSSMGSSHAYGYGGYNNNRGYGHDNSPPESKISPDESLADLAEEETPMPGRHAGRSDYFGGASDAAAAEKDFGGVAGLPQTRQRSDSEHMSADELRRRGSVDDRTMTMSAGRLFVANPDLSD